MNIVNIPVSDLREGDLVELTNGLERLSDGLNSLALRFIGLSFVLACVPCDQRALPAATSPDEQP